MQYQHLLPLLAYVVVHTTATPTAPSPGKGVRLTADNFEGINKGAVFSTELYPLEGDKAWKPWIELTEADQEAFVRFEQIENERYRTLSCHVREQKGPFMSSNSPAVRDKDVKFTFEVVGKNQKEYRIQQNQCGDNYNGCFLECYALGGANKAAWKAKCPAEDKPEASCPGWNSQCWDE